MGEKAIEKLIKKSRKFEEFRRSPALALILSLIFVGLGQIYCGKVAKAIIFWAIIFITTLIIVVYPLLGLLMLIGVYIYNAIDAYTTAKKYNEELIETMLSRIIPKKEGEII